MEWTDRIRRIKLILVLAAIVIAVGSLFVSKQLTDTLKQEEHNRMEVWAEAMKSLNKADENTDLESGAEGHQRERLYPCGIDGSGR